MIFWSCFPVEQTAIFLFYRNFVRSKVTFGSWPHLPKLFSFHLYSLSPVSVAHHAINHSPTCERPPTTPAATSLGQEDRKDVAPISELSSIYAHPLNLIIVLLILSPLPFSVMFSIKETSKGLWSQTALFYLIEWACLPIFFYKAPLAALPKMPFFPEKNQLQGKDLREKAILSPGWPLKTPVLDQERTTGTKVRYDSVSYYDTHNQEIGFKACFLQRKSLSKQLLANTEIPCHFWSDFLIPKGQFIIITLEIFE